MSITWMARAFSETSTVGAERLVLLVLADHANEDGSSWPGIDRIAAHANLSRDHVKRTIRNLESNGLIEREVNGAPDERIRRDRRPNLYRLLICETGGTSDPSRGPRGGHLRGHGGDICAVTGGISAPPKPSVEPSGEPPLIPSLFDSADLPEIPATGIEAGKSKKRNGKAKPSRNAKGLLPDNERAMFEEWWTAYPLKRRKSDAMKAWHAAREAGVSREDLSGSLEAYLTSIAMWEAEHATKFEWVFAAPKFIDGAYMDFLDGPTPDRWGGPPKRSDDEDFDAMAWEISGGAW